jgi:hypothetical protein
MRVLVWVFGQSDHGQNRVMEWGEKACTCWEEVLCRHPLASMFECLLAHLLACLLHCRQIEAGPLTTACTCFTIINPYPLAMLQMHNVIIRYVVDHTDRP